MNSRRSFLKKSLYSGLALSLPAFSACQSSRTQGPKISLAQWSINRAIKDGSLKAEDFAAIAKQTYGIDAVEYVSTFYSAHKTDQPYWADLSNRAASEGVKNLLIMIDAEGDLGDTNKNQRTEAVENHYPWVDVAQKMGCHSIRVNAFGTGERQAVKGALVEGMGQLAAYGQQAGINILIENHGLYSSEADFIVEMIKEVDNPYMGTLPDFGNWCTTEKWGGMLDPKCTNIYDPAQGVKDFLPYAKGVSAKSYDFDKDGSQKALDYTSLLKIVKDYGYEGYIGIEYEGNNLSEPEGIRATKALIEKVWAGLD